MMEREAMILRELETCRHFTGIQHDACKQGVNYSTVRPAVGALPCLKAMNAEPPSHDARRGCCAKLEFRTRDEAEAEIAEAEAHMAKTMRVLKAIHPWRTWTKKNRVEKQEVIECPECKGRLHLSQSAYNGHVWGKCETEGCVQWME